MGFSAIFLSDPLGSQHDLHVEAGAFVPGIFAADTIAAVRCATSSSAA